MPIDDDAPEAHPFPAYRPREIRGHHMNPGTAEMVRKLQEEALLKALKAHEQMKEE